MPSVEHTQSQQYESRNEVDLIDLIMQLWHGKRTILTFVVIALLLAGGYLFIAKQKWSSEAVVTMPDAGQITNYVTAMGILYEQSPGNTPPSIVDVQNRFFSRFNSLAAAFSEQLDKKRKPEKLTIEPAVKGQSMPLRITYVGDSAEHAQTTLTNYLQLINSRVIRELDDDLAISIKSQIDDLKTSLATQEQIAREQQKQRLDVLNQALKVAQESGIRKVTVNQAENQSEDTLYLLGSDALSAMLENEATRPLPLGDAYFATRKALVSVSQLQSKPNLLYSFRYVMKPTLPIHRDSPKTILVIILAILLGGIIGSGYVLGRKSLQEYKLRAES